MFQCVKEIFVSPTNRTRWITKIWLQNDHKPCCAWKPFLYTDIHPERSVIPILKLPKPILTRVLNYRLKSCFALTNNTQKPQAKDQNEKQYVQFPWENHMTGTGTWTDGSHNIRHAIFYMRYLDLQNSWTKAHQRYLDVVSFEGTATIKLPWSPIE